MPNEFPFPPSPAVNFDGVIASGVSAKDARSLANNAWSVLASGVLNQQANTAVVFEAYLGAGRFVKSDVSVGAPVAGTGLTLRQPNATLLIEGRAYVVNEGSPAYKVITGVAPNKAGGVEVFVGIDATTGELITKPEWQFDTFPTSDEDLAAVAGLVHMGRAVTTVSGVTSLTASTRDGYGIIKPRGTATSGGGGGGGDDGPTQDDIDAALQEAKDYADAQDDVLRAEILALLESQGRVPAPSRQGFYAHQMAVMISKIGQLYPLAVEDLEGAHVIADVAGEGSGDTENHVALTTMTKVAGGWTP